MRFSVRTGECRRCKDPVKGGGDIHAEGGCRLDRWPPEVANEIKAKHKARRNKRRQERKLRDSAAASQRGEAIAGTGRAGKEGKGKNKEAEADNKAPKES